MKKLLPWIMCALIAGCASQYVEIEEEIPETAAPQWTTAQIDSIIKLNRMYFFDYYKQMNNRNEFSAESCQRALEYFWNYINFDTAFKYNDYPQAARCYVEWTKFDQTKADSARILYEIGVTKFPSSDYLHNALAIIYKARNELDKAEEHFVAAGKIDPKKTEYFIPLTEIYQQQMRWEDAKNACETVLVLEPANMTIRDRLETILREHFSADEYIAALLKKIELEPNNIGNRISLAKQYLNQAKNEDAKKTIDAALKIEPANVDALELLGLIQENLQNFTGAIEAYKRIVEQTPARADIFLDISVNYKSLKDFTSARNYVLKALEVNPSSGVAYLRYGEIFEASADVCSRGKQANYNDKLVFVIAYGLYEKAAGSDDYNAKDNASKKMKYMESNLILPQKSDWFMHQSEKTPSGDCYKWINENWSEVKYIAQYLKRFSG